MHLQQSLGCEINAFILWHGIKPAIIKILGGVQPSLVHFSISQKGSFFVRQNVLKKGWPPFCVYSFYAVVLSKIQFYR